MSLTRRAPERNPPASARPWSRITRYTRKEHDLNATPQAGPLPVLPHDSEAIVRLRGIEKSFDHGAGRFHVLRRIDLDVRAG